MTDKRTKIITTIGPASESKAVMKSLFESGMTAIRLNFSHGNYKEHQARINTAREISQETGLPLSIVLDTKGPEIRVGKFENNAQEFKRDQIVTIYSKTEDYQNKIFKSGEMSVSYDMSKDLEIGKPILVDDGKLEMIVTEVGKGFIKARAINDHVVSTNKRINLPGTKFSMPFLSEKDKQDIIFGCKNKLDYVAASFVNSAEDVKEIRAIINAHNNPKFQIFAKIESQYGVDHFDEILEEADGIMVARGDLGLEVPYYEVPLIEKRIIRSCRKQGKPVIVATQMLDSMEKNPSPTRAEVIDVYFATELGADATMLSGESAVGSFPRLCVETMATINRRAEKEFYNKLFYPKQLEEVAKNSQGARNEIASRVAHKVINGDYPFTIVLSKTGGLLKEVAKFRPNTAILGVVQDQEMITKFGITSSVFMDTHPDSFVQIKADITNAKEVIKTFSGKPGDKYLVVHGNDFREFVF